MTVVLRPPFSAPNKSGRRSDADAIYVKRHGPSVTLETDERVHGLKLPSVDEISAALGVRYKVDTATTYDIYSVLLPAYPVKESLVRCALIGKYRHSSCLPASVRIICHRGL